MTIFATFRFAIAAFVSALLISPSLAAAGTLATWTNSSGTNAWEVSGNWDINQVPNNSTYDVRLATSAPCNLSSQFQIGSLNLATNTATLNLGPASSLAIANPSGVTNNNMIVVNTTAANLPTTLGFDASAPITGAGIIRLNGINPGNAALSANGVTVTHNAGHTIAGRGDLSFSANQTAFVNNGTITADGPNKDPLRLSLSNSTGNQNNGTIQNTSAGTVIIDQGYLDQSGGGLIQAASQTQITLGANGHMPVILGGFFNGLQLGTFRGVILANRVALNGVTNGFPPNYTGNIQIPAGGLAAILEKGLTNNGYVTVTSTNAANPAVLRFDATCTLDGSGQIRLDGEQPGEAIISANGVAVTIGKDQAIHGHGDINMTANSAALINNGTIEVDGNFFATLRIALSDSPLNQNNGAIRMYDPGFIISLQQGRIDQSGGGSMFVLGDQGLIGTLELGTVQPFTITGGALASAPNDPPNSMSVVKGIAAILDGDITISARFTIPANDYTLVPATRLTNNKTITLEANTSLLRFDNSTTIEGGGAIILTNNATLEINNNKFGNNVRNSSGHTIRGKGPIHIDTGATLTNNGTIAGTHDVDGNLQLSFASNLAFEIGGTVQGTDYDVLHKTDNAPFTLNGKLTVTLINSFVPLASDDFTIITTQTALAGAFTNASSGSRLNTSDGGGSFVVTYSGTNVILSSFGPPLPAPQLLNLSTRGQVFTGDDVLIGGFIVSGSDPKKVIVRALGPSLTNRGVTNPVPDPTLELHNANGGAPIAINDNWKDTQQTEIENSGIPPTDNLESAIVATLPGNAAYTAVLRGKNGATGVALVEIYDLDPASNSKLGNLSSRGVVGIDENVMIGGVIIGATNANGETVLIRGLGPELTQFGIPNVLNDPILELHDPNGNLLALNDNWKDTQQAAIQQTIPPTDPRESAILLTLAPGNYTAILRGANNGTGNGLLEVYKLP